MKPEDFLGSFTKGVENFSWNNLKTKLQNALSEIIPFQFDIHDSLEEKALVFEEKHINEFIEKKFKKHDLVENISVKFFGKNVIELLFTLKKYGLNSSLKQKMEITKIEVDHEKAELTLTVLEKLNIEKHTILGKVIFLLFQDQITDSISKFININQKDNTLLINLKEIALDKLYKKSLNEIITKVNIPFVGNKKVFELINIRKIKTKDNRMLVYFNVTLFK